MIGIHRIRNRVDEEANRNDYDCRDDEGYHDKGAGGDFLVDGIRKGDVGVDEGERAVVGGNPGEKDAGDCDESVLESVLMIRLKTPWEGHLTL